MPSIQNGKCPKIAGEKAKVILEANNRILRQNKRQTQSLKQTHQRVIRQRKRTTEKIENTPGQGKGFSRQG